MSNFDKAVEIIGELATEYGQPGGDELFGLDEDAALALKEDGLIAPDLPEPYPYSGASPCWYEGSFRAGISSTFGGHEPKVTFTNLEPGGVVHMDSESARELAHALLAAAEHAEKEQGNE